MKQYKNKNKLKELVYTAIAKIINTNKVSNKFHIQKFGQLLYKDATTFYKRKFLKFQALDKILSRQSEMAGQ